jgi:glutaredoxin
MEVVHVHKGRIKICPILDWSDQDVATYFDKYKLPFHPLYKLGYRTVGDQHSSQPFDPNIHTSERDTRFHGCAQECGLHVSDEEDEHQEVVKASSSLQEKQSAPTGPGFVLYTKPKCRFCRAAKELIGYLRQQQQQQQHQLHQEEQNSNDDNGEEQNCEQQNGVLSLVVVQEYQVGRDIQLHELKQRLGGRHVTTVPQIWYENNYIGGYGNLVEWVQEAFPNIVGLPDPEKLSAD